MSATVDASQRLRYRWPLLPDILPRALSGGDWPALVADGVSLSAHELRDWVSRLAQALHADGVGIGSPVAVLSRNRPEIVALYCVDQVLGSRSTHLHPMGSLEDHLYAVRDAGAELLLFDAADFGDRADELVEQVPSLRAVALDADAHRPNLHERAAAFAPAPLIVPDVAAEDIAKIGYSGGTTGIPKGIAGTYRNMAYACMIQMAEWEWPTPLRHLVCTPLGHAGAAFIMPTLLRRGTLLVLPAFDVGEVLAAIERWRITSLMLVPSMIYKLLDDPRTDEYDLSSLQTVFYGASLISPHRLREAIERFGPIFFQFYGQAESPMTITVLKKAEHLGGGMERLATCGRPVPWLDVRLLDDDGAEVEPGAPGEICVRGPLNVAGYWNQPDLTDQLFQGEWLRTGDVATIDADGFLTIVDRKKDMIVTGGFNVFPREVEDVIASHPAVSQVAVIGVPHASWGEAVTACVVLRADRSAEAGELVALVREHKGPVAAPKSVVFVNTLPLTGIGKLDKRELRRAYAAGELDTSALEGDQS